MKKLRDWAALSLFLGILSMVALILSHLALTDIYHGEGDLTLEWWILRWAFAVIFLLIVATFIFATLVIKHVHERKSLP